MSEAVCEREVQVPSSLRALGVAAVHVPCGYGEIVERLDAVGRECVKCGVVWDERWVRVEGAVLE